MDLTCVTYSAEGGVARVTLNQPDKRNSLGPVMIADLITALSAAQADQAVRVVIVGGAGKVFCAGGDLAQMEGGAAGAQGKRGSLVDLFVLLSRLGKPTIAQVHGHALAGGLGLAVACDFVIAADVAQFGTPEVQVGVWPMMIMAILMRNVPRKRLIEMMLLGDRFSAQDALAMGLVTRVVPAGELEAHVAQLAGKLCALSPAVIRLGLEALADTQDLSLGEALPLLQQRLVGVLATDDAREGRAAFLEKRAPRWTGK
jgi:enoyl-CoA hydratase/carnithine racemase